MTDSVITKSQTKTYGPRQIEWYGEKAQITATVRYDDQCGNGHNSFAITGEIKGRGREQAGGMLHEEIGKAFPELKPFFKWHLMNADEPMHYIANTLYWLGYSGWCDGKPNSPPKLDYARSAAIWPDMPAELLNDGTEGKREKVTAILESRRESLREEFQKAVESFGFTY